MAAQTARGFVKPTDDPDMRAAVLAAVRGQGVCNSALRYASL